MKKTSVYIGRSEETEERSSSLNVAHQASVRLHSSQSSSHDDAVCSSITEENLSMVYAALRRTTLLYGLHTELGRLLTNCNPLLIPNYITKIVVSIRYITHFR